MHSPLLTRLIISGAMGALRRVVPASDQELFDATRHASDDVKSGTLVLDLLAIPVLLGIGVPLYYALDRVGTLRVSSFVAARILTPAPTAVWVFGAIFGAILGGLLFQRSSGVFFPNWTRSYAASVVTKHGVSYDRSLNLGITAFFLMFVVVVAAGLDTYTALFDDRVVVNEFLSIGESSYSLRDVMSVRWSLRTTSLSGERIIEPRFVVDFTGGRRWCSAWGGERKFEETRRRVVEFISDRTGIRGRAYDVIPREEC